MYRPKVMIADDHALLHDALKKFLEDDCDVVAHALAVVELVCLSLAISAVPARAGGLSHYEFGTADVGLPAPDGRLAHRIQQRC